MPTWHELQEHARTTYKLSKDEPDWFTLVWNYESGRSQLISVRRGTSFEQDWIEFRTFVCKEKEMDPRAALRKNDEMVIGALAMDGDGDYALVHRAPVASLDPDEFALPLQLLAQTADDLEKQFTEQDRF